MSVDTPTPDTTTEMRPDASAHFVGDLVRCDGCQLFRPARPWQRFHSDECRRTFHRLKGRTPFTATVAKVSILKRGEVSIVLRFPAEQQANARQLTPGQVVEFV